MPITTINTDNLTPDLQQKLANFEADKAAYIALQNQYTEVVQENQRLTQKAAELEGQATRTDASWNAMAKSGGIEQNKINEEIERSAQLRKDAQALRLTAEARSSIQNSLVIQVAEARMKLLSTPGVINKEFHQALLTQALEQDGTVEILLELFTLSRAILHNSLNEYDVVLSRCNSPYERQMKLQELTWLTLGKKLEQLFDGAQSRMHAPTLATIPPGVPKEAVVNSTSDLRKLKRTNGVA